jgi:hypothetical protein
MRKLEDKLSASIKPRKGRAPRAASAKAAPEPEAVPATESPTPQQPATEGSRPLHPRRIWPD